MFDITTQMLVQLVGLIPYMIALILIFDLLGSLLFGKR